jgi:Uma2 family endonuclease
MTAVAKTADWISPEEFIAGELSSEVRHEYLDGRVYAMAGASDEHNRIARNVLVELANALHGKRCEPFGSDMKIRIPPAFGDAYYYPDVSVSCDPADRAKFYRERPALIVEVLSPETERIDRGEKALAYRHIASLEVYVLIEQDRFAATVLHRADKEWKSEVIEGRDAVLQLPHIGVEIPFERIYERTSLLTGSQ